MEKNLELVFALVGPVGSDLRQVSSILKASLKTVGFSSEEISLSEILHYIERYSKQLDSKDEYSRILTHMEAGNNLRSDLELGEALALLAVRMIYQKRFKKTKNKKPLPRTAFILRSLKHPEEAHALRLIYGKSFHLISVYSPRNVRLQKLACNIKDSVHQAHVDQFIPLAEKLIVKDESEIDYNKYGQDVRGTYPFGDLFVNAGDSNKLKQDLNRYIELLFGNSLRTPNREEYGMFNAYASAKRSGSLARQVGAVIANDTGDVISAGMNEVPKYEGGQFMEGDNPIYRNMELGHDPSDKRRYAILVDILKALQTLELLKSTSDPVELAKELRTKMKNAQFMSLIEFTTEVHAEMAAITSAARNTMSVKGCTLFTTTFPCHDCTKHIIASGITRVLYMEPYPKSLAKELFPKLIAVDEDPAPGCKVTFAPFVGVAPSRFIELFTMGKRKDPDGNRVEWDPKVVDPIFFEAFPVYKVDELDAIKKLSTRLKQKRIKLNFPKS